MAEPHPRLRAARVQAGHETAADFAQAHELEEGTYRSHENGTRALTVPMAKRYAEALGVSWKWLMFGDDFAGESQLPRPKRALPGPPRPGMLVIEELDVRAGNALGGQVVEDEHQKPVAEWHVPAVVVRAYTSAPAEQIKIITCVGDSNVPEILPGQRVMVDTADRAPSPPGFFALWDGFGEIIKRLEMIPHSDPPRVKVKSANPAYDPYEEMLANVTINGRVIGKWSWT